MRVYEGKKEGFKGRNGSACLGETQPNEGQKEGLRDAMLGATLSTLVPV